MFKTIDTEGLFRARAAGIKPFIFSDLNSIVILSGPNGGGKSRVLGLLDEARTVVFEKDAKKLLNQYTAELKRLELLLSDNPDNPDLITAADNVRPHLKAIQHRVDNPHCCVATPPGADFSVVSLPPGLTHLSGDISNLGWSHLKAWEQPMSISQAEGTNRFHLHLMSMVYALYHAEHPRHATDPATLRNARRAAEFINLVQALTGIKLSYELVGVVPTPTLDGRRYVASELSLGQAALLGWAVLLESKLWTEQLDRTASVQRFVVALDEPENFLHPHAATSVLRRLSEYLGERGQIWVATHSPTILAAFQARASVFYVYNGIIEYASANITKVIEGLVGGEDERRSLRDILDNADGVAFYKFAAESLRDALVVGEADSDDLQSKQLTSMIRHRLRADRPLRVLDYGSGKARFAMALAEALSQEEKSLVEYMTYDDVKYDKYKGAKLQNIARLYPRADPREISARTSTSISDYKIENRVDIVVLCNTLHEIEVGDWRSVFRTIQEFLADDGVLLILEDLQLPVGELPNSTGFIVLNLDEVRTLFGTVNNVCSAVTETRTRCSAVTVTRSALNSVFAEDYPDRLVKTLRDLKERALREIDSVRSERGTSHRDGRTHARAAMLLANAEIALKRLGLS